MNDADHVGDLISGYLLGSLDDEETLRVARHLPSCPLCRREVDSCSRVLEELAMAGPEISPPDDLWERLERRVAAAERAGTAAAETAAPSGRVRRLHLPSGRALVTAAMAACLLVVAGVGATRLFVRAGQGAPALSGSRMPIFHLAGTGQAPRASALVVSNSDGERGTLIVDGLPPLSADTIYQLWLIRGGASVGGATFTVDDEGYATVIVHAPRPLTDYSGFSVTVEPRGGSAAPTGPPLLAM